MKDICFIHLESVDSTNLFAKRQAATFDPEVLTCITAAEQTAGMGQWGKKWFSPKDLNLYITFYFTTTSRQPNIGQFLAQVCIEFLSEMGILAQLKLPNDLLVNGKKLGGILTEMISIQDKIGVILGLGLNVNMPENLLKQIDQPATSLALLLHQNIDVQSLIPSLASRFIQSYGRI